MAARLIVRPPQSSPLLMEIRLPVGKIFDPFRILDPPMHKGNGCQSKVLQSVVLLQDYFCRTEQYARLAYNSSIELFRC